MKVHWKKDKDDDEILPQEIQDRLNIFAKERVSMMLEAVTLKRLWQSPVCPDDEEEQELVREAKDRLLAVTSRVVLGGNKHKNYNYKIAELAEAIYEECLKIIREGKQK